MAHQHSRLPIQRGLVAERKARLQEIKQRNESSRDTIHLQLLGPLPGTDGREFRTAFGTPTTVRSSPRRSRTSLISSYVSNDNLADKVRRKRSAVTISGPVISPKPSNSSLRYRRPTPFKKAMSGSQSSESPPVQPFSELELHQPTPQNVRSKLADGLESCISDVHERWDASSRTPSNADFARVLSHAIGPSVAGESFYTDMNLLKQPGSEETLRAASEVSHTGTTGTATRGKREMIRGFLKVRGSVQADTDSLQTEPRDKSKILRIFSSRHTRTTSDTKTNSDLGSSDIGDLATEYQGTRLIVAKCRATHEYVMILDEKGEVAAILTVTSRGWNLASNMKQKHGRCPICDQRT